MLSYLTDIYRQAVVVLESSSELPNSYAPDVLVLAASGTYAHTTQVSPGVPEFVDASPRTESMILKTTFSSVPIISQSELREEYQELGTALGEMTEFEDGDEWKIDAPVYAAACYVASELMVNSFPAPRIFNHGPKSIVFNWSKEEDNLYLTVSADRMSALISSPERIERRIHWSANQLTDPSLAFSTLKAAYSEKPVKITGAVADPPEL